MPNKVPTSNSVPDATTPDNHKLPATNELIEAICNNVNLPALGSAVSRVVRASSSEHESMHQLARFVLLDASLTQKILSLANSVIYRSQSGQVTTSMSKAIHLLGLDTVRTCAMAAILSDSLPNKHVQCVNNELMYALTASIIGRELANQIHLKDVEEVATAALFKNIGRLMVAAYDHNLYWEIMRRIDEENQTPEKAAKQVLGCGFELLTLIALQKSQIPSFIIQAIKCLSPKAKSTPKSRQDWIQQAVIFSDAFTPTILYGHEPSNVVAQNKVLLTQFDKTLNLDQAALKTLTSNVRNETESLNIKIKIIQPINQENDIDPEEEVATSELEEELLSEIMLSNNDASELQTTPYHPSGKPFNASIRLTTSVQDITKIIISGNYKVDKLLGGFLEAIYGDFCFNFAAILLKDIRTDQFRARYSMGENSVSLKKSLCFPVSLSRNLFGLAMEKDIDVFISDNSDTKIHHLIPSWHQKFLPTARSFIVLPLVIERKPIGLLYANRSSPSPEGISAEEMSLIKLLKGQVLTALNT